jgi:hypothetical protein
MNNYSSQCYLYLYTNTIYAALLNVSSLHMLNKKSFGKDYIKQVFDNFLDFSHLNDENESIRNTAISIESTVSSTNININNDNDFKSKYLQTFNDIVL